MENFNGIIKVVDLFIIVYGDGLEYFIESIILNSMFFNVFLLW